MGRARVRPCCSRDCEHRIAAPVADCGSFDLQASFLERIPPPQTAGLLDDLARYSLSGHAEKVSCPVWVCNAQNDDVGVSAPRLVAALTTDTQFVQFTADEGARDHCEQGARALYHARSFGWLDDLLHPENPASATDSI